MPKIIIKRKGAAGYRFSDINIFTNGEKIGDIAIKESKEFELIAGAHKIHAQVGGSESQPISITVSDNDVYTFELSAAKSLVWIIAICVLVSFVDLFFGDVLNLPKYSLVAIYTPALIAAIYFSTLGRKKYLVLKEVESVS